MSESGSSPLLFFPSSLPFSPPLATWCKPAAPHHRRSVIALPAAPHPCRSIPQSRKRLCTAVQRAQRNAIPAPLIACGTASTPTTVLSSFRLLPRLSPCAARWRLRLCGADAGPHLAEHVVQAFGVHDRIAGSEVPGAQIGGRAARDASGRSPSPVESRAGVPSREARARQWLFFGARPGRECRRGPERPGQTFRARGVFVRGAAHGLLAGRA